MQLTALLLIISHKHCLRLHEAYKIIKENRIIEGPAESQYHFRAPKEAVKTINFCSSLMKVFVSEVVMFVCRL